METEISSVIKGLLSAEVTSLTQISGGRNSKVYRVECGAKDRYIAKFYPQQEPTGDGAPLRDRLALEFNGLTFLRDQGVEAVPAPIAADRNVRCGIYELIEGEHLTPLAVTEQHIDQSVEFLVKLKELAAAPSSGNLPPAAEACFTIEEISASIHQRLDRVSRSATTGPETGSDEHRNLAVFLRDSFIPALGRVESWCQSALEDSGISFDRELEMSQMTLSPSDFGFHNALVRPDGRLVFVDFEYFGWDDPAKTVSDFLLHPGMDLSPQHKAHFYRSMVLGFGQVPDLARRVEIVYPLFGLKWCLILLNEFISENLRRRGLASVINLDTAQLQRNQLEKSQRLLERITSEYQRFPHAK